MRFPTIGVAGSALISTSTMTISGSATVPVGLTGSLTPVLSQSPPSLTVFRTR